MTSPDAAVLVVGPLPPPIHGAARVTALMVDQLREEGVQVVAINTSGAESGKGLGHHLARIRVHLWAAWQLVRHRRRWISLYLGGAGGLGLWYQAFVIMFARACGVQVVFHHHSYKPLNAASAGMSTAVRLGGRRMVHVALCDGMAATLRASYPRVTDVEVVSNASMLPAAAIPVVRAPKPPFVLGHLGNLVLEKGLDVVIDSLRRVRAGGVDARLLLGGPVRSDEAAQVLASAQAEFGDALVHLGPVPKDEVDDFYAKIDLFVFPARYVHEAEPLVVLEAARCGAASVAFDVGCVAGMVLSPEWVVPSGTDLPGRVAELVTRLQADGERAHVGIEVMARFDERRTRAIEARRRLTQRIARGEAR